MGVMVGAGVRKLKVRGAITGAVFADAVCASRHPITANDLCAQRLCGVSHKTRKNLCKQP